MNPDLKHPLDPYEILKDVCLRGLKLADESDRVMYELKKDIAPIRIQIETALKELESPQIVTIAILGDTGAGKSSLINALLKGQFLPWSNSDICTAAVTRLKFSESKSYRITVKFINQQVWQNEVQSITRELEVAASDSDEPDEMINRKKTKRIEPESKDDRDKLKAIYGSEAYKDFLHTLSTDVLINGPRVEEVLANGTVIHETTESSVVLKTLENYLVKTGDSDQVWPLIEDVLIEGPFEALRHGSELVDLPGLSDTNQARAQKTLDYLNQAKFIFIAYESWRPPSDVIQEVFRSSRLLQERLLLSAKKDALTFIATKSDIFGEDDRKFEILGLNPTLNQKAILMVEEREKSLLSALNDFAESVSEAAVDDRSADEIESAIKASKYFFTSSTEYTRIIRTDVEQKLTSNSKFVTQEQTGIPALTAHINRITLEVGPKVLYRRIWNELLSAESSFRIVYNNQFVRFMGLNELNTERIAKLKQQVAQFTLDLNATTAELIVEMQKQLEEATQSFFLTTQISRMGIERALEDFAIYLRSRHWATLRATTVRGGWFHSSSGEIIDLAQEASRPIIKKFLGPWVDLFATALMGILQILELKMDSYTDKYISLIQVAQEDVSDQVEFVAGLDDLLKAVENLIATDINKLKQQIQSEIESRRGTLIDLIVSSVRKVMAPAIEKASFERGSGMKVRMTETLVEGAAQLSPETYEKVLGEIVQAVNSTSQKLVELLNKVPLATSERTSNINNYFEALKKKPAVIDEVSLTSLGKNINHFAGSLKEISYTFAKWIEANEIEFEEVLTSSSAIQHVVKAESKKEYIVVDGSNVATRTMSDLKRVASLTDLLNCLAALQIEYPNADIEVFVDSSFRHDLFSRSEKKQYEELAITRKITEGAPGVVGDKIFLKHASRRQGRVVSKDNFRRERAEFPFVEEDGRVITWTHMADNSWVFEPRIPSKRPFPKSLRNSR